MDTKCDLRLVEIIIKLSCVLHLKAECLVSTTHRTLHIFRVIFHSIPVYFLFHFYFSLKIHKIIQLWQSLTWSCHGREAIVSNQSKLKSFVVAQMKINFKRILIYCVLFQVACFNFSSFFLICTINCSQKSYTCTWVLCKWTREKKREWFFVLVSRDHPDIKKSAMECIFAQKHNWIKYQMWLLHFRCGKMTNKRTNLNKKANEQAQSEKNDIKCT